MRIDDYEWQLQNKTWVFGPKVRGVVRKILASVEWVEVHYGESGWFARTNNGTSHPCGTALLEAIDWCEKQLRDTHGT